MKLISFSSFCFNTIQDNIDLKLLLNPLSKESCFNTIQDNIDLKHITSPPLL